MKVYIVNSGIFENHFFEGKESACGKRIDDLKTVGRSFLKDRCQLISESFSKGELIEILTHYDRDMNVKSNYEDSRRTVTEWVNNHLKDKK